MASNGPPDTLNHRHDLVASLLGTGLYTESEVAKLTNYSTEHIRRLKQSPLFQRLVEAYQERCYKAPLAKAAAHVAQDAVKNAEFLTSVRNGDIMDDKDEMRARLRASEVLFSRQMPVRSPGERTPAQIVININADDAQRLDSIAAEVVPARAFDEFEHDYAVALADAEGETPDDEST